MKAAKPLIFVTVSEGDLQRPDFFRMIGCAVDLGRPKRKSSTLHYIVLLDLPKERTSFDVLNRVQEVGVGVISSHPISGAILLVSLSQVKTLRPLQKYAVLMSHEDDKEALLEIKPEFIIFRPQSKEEVETLLDWLKVHQIQIPVILHISSMANFLKNQAVKGVWLDATTDIETRRHTALNFFMS